MTTIKIILIINTLWFLGGFFLFGLQPKKCMKLFRPDLDVDKKENQLPLKIIPFVGGFNVAFVVLNVTACLLF